MRGSNIKANSWVSGMYANISTCGVEIWLENGKIQSKLKSFFVWACIDTQPKSYVTVRETVF